jgi:hypothetical protein
MSETDWRSFRTEAFSKLILRPALGLARRLHAEADQLVRDLVEHGLAPLESVILILRDQLSKKILRNTESGSFALRCHPLRTIWRTIKTVAILRSRHANHQTLISVGDVPLRQGEGNLRHPCHAINRSYVANEPTENPVRLGFLPDQRVHTTPSQQEELS